MDRAGLSVAAIAEIEGTVERSIRRTLEEAARLELEREPSAEEEKQPKKLSRRVLLHRAWDYVERHPVYALGLAENSFWVRLVIATHEHGDGYQLGIGEDGAYFQNRSDLGVLLLGQLSPTPADIDDWLKKLFCRGRLIDIDGVDIALPLALGLTPGENARGGRVRRGGPSGPRGQLEMLHVVQGGLSDAPSGGKPDPSSAASGPENADSKPPSPRTQNPSDSDSKPDSKPTGFGLKTGLKTPSAADSKPPVGGLETRGFESEPSRAPSPSLSSFLLNLN